MSSVGVEMTHVANPPRAPAMNVVSSVGCFRYSDVVAVVVGVVVVDERGGVSEP